MNIFTFISNNTLFNKIVIDLVVYEYIIFKCFLI